METTTKIWVGFGLGGLCFAIYIISKVAEAFYFQIGG